MTAANLGEEVETHWIVAGGVRSRVRETGTGRPLLMLHGAGPGVDARFNWWHLWPLLTGRFRCLAPDLAGFGASLPVGPAPIGESAWTDLRVAQAVGVLDELGLDDVDVLGNSRGGGAVALKMLIRHPDRVRSAVLMGGAGYFASADTPRGGSRFYDDPSPAAMEAMILGFVHDRRSLPAPLPDLVELRIGQALSPGAEELYRRMFVEPHVEFAQADLAAITHRVLVLHGRRDRISDLANSVALSGLIPSADLHVLAGGGHWMHVDRAAEFARLISGWVLCDAANPCP